MCFFYFCWWWIIFPVVVYIPGSNPPLSLLQTIVWLVPLGICRKNRTISVWTTSVANKKQECEAELISTEVGIRTQGSRNGWGLCKAGWFITWVIGRDWREIQMNYLWQAHSYGRAHTHSHTHKLIVGLNRLQEEKEQEQEGDETQGLLKNERKSEGLWHRRGE